MYKIKGISVSDIPSKESRNQGFNSESINIKNVKNFKT